MLPCIKMAFFEPGHYGAVVSCDQSIAHGNIADSLSYIDPQRVH